jgi:ankyrin repeat protein
MRSSIVGELLQQAPHLAAGPFSVLLHAWQRHTSDHPPPAADAPPSRETQLLNSHTHGNWIMDNARYTAAHFAGHCGSVQLLAQLKDELGMCLTLPDLHRSLPMHYAAKEGNAEAFEFLVTACGSDVTTPDERSRNVAHLACASGHDKILELIEQHHRLVDLCALPDSTNLVPVHVAATHGHEACIRMCACAGVDIAVTDSLQRHAVAYAAEQGHNNILTFYVEEMGQSVLLARDKFLASCAHHAARQGQLETLSFLAAHGVDLDALDKNGRSPAFWAVLGGKTKAHIDTIQFLRQQGSDLLLRDTAGNSLLDVALSKYSRETNIVKYLSPIVGPT